MRNGLLILLVTISFTGIKCGVDSGASPVSFNANQQIALRVKGMVCAVGCARFIEEEVSSLPGIGKCEVDFDKGTAIVSFDKDLISDKDIVSTINGLNDGQYNAEVIESLKAGKQGNKPGRAGRKEVQKTDVRFQFPELVTYFMSRLMH